MVVESEQEPCCRKDCDFNNEGDHCSTSPELSVGNACKTFRFRGSTLSLTPEESK